MDQVPWTNTMGNGHLSRFYALLFAQACWHRMTEPTENAPTGHVNGAMPRRWFSSGAWEAVEKQLRSSWEAVEKQLRSSWEAVEKQLRSSWEAVEKQLRSSWEAAGTAWHKLRTLIALTAQRTNLQLEPTARSNGLNIHTHIRAEPAPSVMFRYLTRKLKASTLNAADLSRVCMNSDSDPFIPGEATIRGRRVSRRRGRDLSQVATQVAERMWKNSWNWRRLTHCCQQRILMQSLPIQWRLGHRIDGEPWWTCETTLSASLPHLSHQF